MPNEEDLTHLRGEVIGPPDTPYEGGHYDLEILIPDSYPFTPPKVEKRGEEGMCRGDVSMQLSFFAHSQVRFLTKIWHPNVSSVTGAICLVRKDEIGPSPPSSPPPSLPTPRTF